MGANRKNGKNRKNEKKKKKIRVVNPTKKADKDSRLREAKERLAKALKRIEDANKKKAASMARKAELEALFQTQSEAEQQKTKTELDALDQEMTGVDLEINNAKEEESMARKEQKDVEMLDVTEPQEVDDPDKPEPTTEGPNPGGPSKKKKKKSTKDEDENSDDDSDDSDDSDDDSDDSEDEEEDVYPGLINHEEIKEALGTSGGICKGWTKVGAHGKRPVVQLGPNSSPAFRTMKASQFEGFINPNSKYNLVKQRRCDVRNKNDTKKFTIDDVESGIGVSFRPDDNCKGNPAEKLKPLPPRLTKKEKDAMKARGEAIPEEPKPEPVQVFLKWNTLYKGKWTSFETRGGIRGLYGDDAKGDKFIYKLALYQEERYQEYLKGIRPGSSRTASPFGPGDENTPPPGDQNGKSSTSPEGPPAPGDQNGKSLTGPGGPPPPGDQNGKSSTGPGGPPPPGDGIPPGGRTESDKVAKKAAMDEFKEDYLMGVGVDTWGELTTQQQADGIEAFRLFYAKKQVAG